MASSFTLNDGHRFAKLQPGEFFIAFGECDTDLTTTMLNKLPWAKLSRPQAFAKKWFVNLDVKEHFRLKVWRI